MSVVQAGKRQADPSSVPFAPALLGALGAVPFVALAAAAVIDTGALAPAITFAVTSYGAVILSFLGGVQWGLAMGKQRDDPPGLAVPLTISVIPSLVAWAALFLPDQPGVLVLAAAFAVVGLHDMWASRRAAAPEWYGTLRVWLSSIVVPSLLIAAFG